MAAIDRHLPNRDVREVHGTVLDVPPPQAVVAALAAPGGPDAIVRFLLRVREVAGTGSVEELPAGLGLEPLAAARRASLRYWRVVGPFSGLIRRRWLAGVPRSLAG